MFKILLVDDSDLIREGIATMFMGQEGFEIIGECRDGAEVIPFLSRGTLPDVILMDITMPFDGIEATKLVHHEFPSIKIIALSMHSHSVYVERMMAAGASGYLLKSTSFDEMKSAIQSVAAADQFFGADVDQSFSQKEKQNGNASRNNLGSLTEPEILLIKGIVAEQPKEVLRSIVQSSMSDLEHQISNLKAKLDVKSNSELVRYAIVNNLV